MSFSAGLNCWFNYCFRLIYTRMISVTLLICENKNNLPVVIIFISWWKSLCRTAHAQLLVQVQSFSRSSALILMDSDHFVKNNLSSRKLYILCSGGYQLSLWNSTLTWKWSLQSFLCHSYEFSCVYKEHKLKEHKSLQQWECNQLVNFKRCERFPWHKSRCPS